MFSNSSPNLLPQKCTCSFVWGGGVCQHLPPWWVTWDSLRLSTPSRPPDLEHVSIGPLRWSGLTGKLVRGWSVVSAFCGSASPRVSCAQRCCPAISRLCRLHGARCPEHKQAVTVLPVALPLPAGMCLISPVLSSPYGRSASWTTRPPTPFFRKIGRPSRTPSGEAGVTV